MYAVPYFKLQWAAEHVPLRFRVQTLTVKLLHVLHIAKRMFLLQFLASQTQLMLFDRSASIKSTECTSTSLWSNPCSSTSKQGIIFAERENKVHYSWCRGKSTHSMLLQRDVNRWQSCVEDLLLDFHIWMKLQSEAAAWLALQCRRPHFYVLDPSWRFVASSSSHATHWHSRTDQCT